MKVINFTDKTPLKEEDAKQMAEAIKAFEEGKEQPRGRFIIIGELGKESY